MYELWECWYKDTAQSVLGHVLPDKKIAVYKRRWIAKLVRWWRASNDQRTFFYWEVREIK